MRKYLIPLLLVGLLSGCGQKDPEQSHTEATIVPDQIPPVYVDLPQREADRGDLVFQGWVTPEGEAAPSETDADARHRDVSQLDNVLALPSEYAEQGEEISLPLRLCGRVELCAFDLKLTYDKNRLEYLGCEDADDELMVHAKAGEGVIRVNYLHGSDLTGEKTLCTLRFRVTTQQPGQSLVHMEVIEAVCLGNAGEIIICDANPVHSTVWLNQKAGEAE